MRLIDADKLKKEINGFKAPYREKHWSDKSDKYAEGVYDGVLRVEFFVTFAHTFKTKEVKYFDEDEKVWKIGRVIVDE